MDGQRIRGYFYNNMRYINLRFTFTYFYSEDHSYLPCLSEVYSHY